MHSHHVIIIAVLLTISGCRTGKPDYNEVVSGENHTHNNVSLKLKRSDVVAAYERARASMLLEEQVHVDVLWVLTQFKRGDQELDAFIAEARQTVPERTYVPEVFPDLPRKVLPEHPNTGIRKFFTYVQAAFGQPQDRGLLYLQDFIAGENSGYILTHQFLSLIWAEQAGLPITDEMLSRRRELWQKVYDEQRDAERVDSIDLYVERVAIVLAYGRKNEIDKNEVDQWIHAIIDLQQPNGAWPLSNTPIQYDGGNTLLHSPRSHTTALAMMALDAYLHRGW